MGFYINPSRRPPAVPGRGSGSPGAAARPHGSLRGPPRRSWDRPSPGGGRPGTAGVGAPVGGSEGSPLLLPEEGSAVPGRCRRASPTPVF